MSEYYALNMFEEQKAARTSRSDFRKKLKLENVLKTKLDQMFRDTVKKFRSAFGSRGEIISVSALYGDKLFRFLRDHYDKVDESFVGSVIHHNRIFKQTENELIDQVLEQLMGLSNITASLQSAIINETTEKQMREALARARQMAREEGTPDDNRSIAPVAAVLLTRLLRPRSESISLFETQSRAESVKNVEAGIIKQNMDQLNIQRRPDTKSWVTMGDSKVRSTHRAANNQTVLIDTFFRVGNSNLNYPADTSTGAPIEETINCRCSAVYNIAGRL